MVAFVSRGSLLQYSKTVSGYYIVDYFARGCVDTNLEIVAGYAPRTQSNDAHTHGKIYLPFTS